MTKYILFLFLSFICYAKDYTPVEEIKVSGIVKDMVLRENKLCIGSDNGTMQIYDIEQKKFIKKIQLPKIKDFMGDMINTRVNSVDYLNSRYILVSDSGIGGYSNVSIVENNNTKIVISHEKNYQIVKARLIDKNHLLLGLLSNELILYNLDNNKEIYRIQVSESRFSDFALNEDKTKVAVSNESGIIYIVDTKTGKILKELKGQNVDNVYKVAFRKNIVSGGGKDRRGSIYDINSGKGEYIQGKFFIYSTGLSPSAQKVAFAMDEKNNIYIYNTFTKSLLAKLKGQKSVLNNIIFKDESTIFSSSDDDTIMKWELK